MQPCQRNNLNPISYSQTISLASNEETVEFIDSKAMLQDQIFTYLIKKGVVDKSGNLNASFHKIRKSYLSETQLNRLYNELDKAFTVKSRNGEFEFTISLKELFNYLGVDTIEIVGGSVFWLLGEEYMREVCDDLKIPQEMLSKYFFKDFERKAADLDIRITNIDDPESFKMKVCHYFAVKLKSSLSFKEKTELILKEGFTKYYTHVGQTNQDNFGIVAFGNQDFSVDLLFVKSLERTNLFKHDGIKIAVSNLDSKFPLARIQGAKGPILESSILKLTKILNAENIDQIDLAGALMLFSYMTKGWRYTQENLESTLVSKLNTSGNIKLLTKNLKNHFPNQPFAATVFCFNICQKLELTSIRDIAKALLIEMSGKEKSFLTCFHEAMLLLTSDDLDENYFKIIQDLMQILGHLLLNNGNEKLQVFKTLIDKNSYLQFKFNLTDPLYLVVKDDLTKACQNINELLNTENKNDVLKIVSSFKEYLTFEKFCTYDMSPELIKIAYEWCGRQELALKQLGFHLLCKGNVGHELYLLEQLPLILHNEECLQTRKNLLNHFKNYWGSTSRIENFDFDLLHEAAMSPYCKPGDLLKAFCLSFRGCKSPIIREFIFKSWHAHSDLFSSKDHSLLIQNFKSTNPLFSLKILSALANLNGTHVNTLVAFFDSLYTEYSLPKNQTFWNRDLEILSDVAIKVMAHVTNSKKPLKPEEMQCLKKSAEDLIKVDFFKGYQLSKQLIDKKIFDFELCRHFIKNALTHQHIEIATEELKLYFIHYAIKNQTLPSEILLIFEQIFNKWIEKKNFYETLSLLEHAENKFPAIDNSSKWKNLALISINTEMEIKKIQIFLKKLLLLSTEPEIKPIVLVHIHSLLNDPSNFAQNSDSIFVILKLIESYCFDDMAINGKIKEALIYLGDKKLVEASFATLKKTRSLDKLKNIFYPLLLTGSVQALQFLKDDFEISERHEECSQGLLHLINSKSNPYEKIEKAYFAIRSTNIISSDKQLLLDLKYMRANIKRENYLSLKVWEVLQTLASTTDKKEVLQEVTQFFLKLLSLFKKTDTIEPVLDFNMVRFLLNMEGKHTPLVMIPFLNFLSVHNTETLLKMGTKIAHLIIKDCPHTKPNLLKGPYVEFKKTLKNLINANFELKNLNTTQKIISDKFFTNKEIQDFRGKIAKTLFDDPATLLCEAKIIRAIETYLICLNSPEESMKYLHDNTKGLINCLTALLFTHKNPKFYYMVLAKILGALFIYSDSSILAPELIPPLFRQELFNATNEEKEVMNEKIYCFITVLLLGMTYKIIEDADQLDAEEIQIISKHLAYIFCLMPFPKKKEETISLLMHCCTTAQFLPETHLTDWLSEIATIAHQLTQRDFFEKVPNDKALFEAFGVWVYCSLPLTTFAQIPDRNKAFMIFNHIKALSMGNGVSSMVLAFNYFNTHEDLLMKYFPNDSIIQNQIMVAKSLKFHPEAKNAVL